MMGTFAPSDSALLLIDRLLRVRAWWPKSMATTTVETYRFDELGARFAVFVGLDAAPKTVCFHRTLREA